MQCTTCLSDVPVISHFNVMFVCRQTLHPAATSMQATRPTPECHRLLLYVCVIFSVR